MEVLEPKLGQIIIYKCEHCGKSLNHELDEWNRVHSYNAEYDD